MENILKKIRMRDRELETVEQGNLQLAWLERILREGSQLSSSERDFVLQEIKESNKEQTDTFKSGSSGWKYYLPSKINPSRTDDPLYISRSRVKSVNLYLNHQVSRLIKLRDNPEHYWALAGLLIQRSEAFQVFFFHKAFGKEKPEGFASQSWWRTWEKGKVLSTFQEFNRLCKFMKPEVKMDRVYIPKGKLDESGNMKYRPLGVPRKAYRALAVGINFMFQTYIPDHPRQHLFLPGKGLHTAWRWILDNIESIDNVYEYDLKGFFNSIYVDHISHILRSRYNVRGWALRWLHRANHSLFSKWKVLTDEVNLLNGQKGTGSKAKEMDISEASKLIASDVDMQSTNEASIWQGISNHSQVYDHVPDPNRKRLKTIKRHMSKMELPADPLALRKRGIPQGIAWSPLISTSMLPFSNIFNLPGIAAADDGIYTWNGPSIPDVNLHISEGRPCTDYWLPSEIYQGYCGQDCLVLDEEGNVVPGLQPTLHSKWLNGQKYEEIPKGYRVTGSQGKTALSNMTRYSGIEFSSKEGSMNYIRKDGNWVTPVYPDGTLIRGNWPLDTKVLGRLHFLGSTLWVVEHPESNQPMLYMDNGEATVMLSELQREQDLKQFLGKVLSYRGQEWSATTFDKTQESVFVSEKSIMALIPKWGMLAVPENFERSTYFRIDFSGRLAYSDLTDKSAICTELLLEQLEKGGPVRRYKRSKYTLPMDASTLWLHEKEHWSEKDHRGRPKTKIRGPKLQRETSRKPSKPSVVDLEEPMLIKYLSDKKFIYRYELEQFTGSRAERREWREYKTSKGR